MNEWTVAQSRLARNRTKRLFSALTTTTTTNVRRVQTKTKQQRRLTAVLQLNESKLQIERVEPTGAYRRAQHISSEQESEDLRFRRLSLTGELCVRVCELLPVGE